MDDWDDDDDRACTMCGGEWYLQECDDPIQCCDPRCDGTWHPCVACDGTGLAEHQWAVVMRLAEREALTCEDLQH